MLTKFDQKSCYNFHVLLNIITISMSADLLLCDMPQQVNY